MVHDRAMGDRHGWVFDLVNDDELRRRRARKRARERDNALLAANTARNEVWWRVGQTWAPDDPAMAAEMARAEAEHAAALAETFFAPIAPYLRPGWSRQSGEKQSSEQFAILYLEWEMAYPDEWYQDAGTYLSPSGLKGSILRAMDWHGVSEPDRAAVERLLLAAVRGPYRAKDWRYTRVARHLDSRPLREALGTIADGEDDTAALRAAFVLSRLDNPALSANRRSYDNWLKQRTQT